MKMPMPKGTFGQFRNEDAMAELEQGLVVEQPGAGHGWRACRRVVPLHQHHGQAGLDQR